MADLQLRVLGRFDARSLTDGPDTEPLALGGSQPRRLLAALVARQGSTTVDALADVIWSGEPPTSAKGSIQAYVSRLRKELGSEAIVRDGERYALGSSVEVDAWEMERLSESAEAVVDPAAKAAILGEALAHWGGAFAGDDEHPLLRSAAVRFELVQLHVRESLAAAQLEGGRADLAVVALEQLVNDSPYRERVWDLYLRSLYAVGRRRDALNGFAALRTRFLDDLGIEPGPEFSDLEQAMLRDDAAALAVNISADVESTAALINAPLVGRSVELSLVRSTQAGRVVLVSGPAGIGKSRLVQTALPNAVVVRCWEGDSPAGWPWIEVTDRLGLDPSSIDTTPFEARRVTVEALLEHARSSGPFTLVVEDLHWADHEALLQFRHLGEQLAGSALTLVGTYRDADLDPDGARILGSMSSEPHAVSVPLLPLDLSLCSELLALMCRRPLTELERERVFDLTAGNPFLVTQLGRRLALGGDLGGALAAPEMLDPERTAVINDAFQRLDDDDREVLAVAAVCGVRFEIPVVAAVMGRSVSDELARSVREGLLQSGPGESHDFVHPLVHAIVLSRVDEATRAQLHDRVADALDSSPEASSSAISHHRQHGTRDRLDRSVVEVHLRAADEAMTVGSWTRAAEVLGRAAHDAALTTLPRREQLEIAVKSSEAWRSAGEVSRCRVIVSGLVEDVQEHAPDLLPALALAHAGFGAGGFNIDAGGVDLIALALESSTATPEQRVRLRSRLSLASFSGSVIPPSVDEASLEPKGILDDAAGLGDQLTLSWALGCSLIKSIREERTEDRLTLARQLLDAAVDEDAVVMGLAHEHEALLGLGRGDEASIVRDSIRRHAESSQRPAHLWYARQFAAGAALRRGDLLSAELLAGEALGLGLEPHGLEAMAGFGSASVAIAWLRDGLTELAALDLFAALDQSALGVTTSLDLGQIVVRAGAGESADWPAEVERIVAATPRLTQLDRLLIGEIATFTASPALVPVATGGFADDDLGIITTPGCGIESSVLSHLGRMAEFSGDLVRARDLLTRGLEVERDAGMVLWACRTEAHLCLVEEALGIDNAARRRRVRGVAADHGVDLLTAMLD